MLLMGIVDDGKITVNMSTGGLILSELGAQFGRCNKNKYK
jgi:hypothetical protein